MSCRGLLSNNNGTAVVETHGALYIIYPADKANAATTNNNLSFANNSRAAAQPGGPACQNAFIGTKRADLIWFKSLCISSCCLPSRCVEKHMFSALWGDFQVLIVSVLNIPPRHYSLKHECVFETQIRSVSAFLKGAEEMTHIVVYCCRKQHVKKRCLWHKRQPCAGMAGKSAEVGHSQQSSAQTGQNQTL